MTNHIINTKRFGLVEKVTMTHFLLMFGYKLFSIFFPLYLLERGFSIIEVGYTSFLIYLGIAITSPIAGYLNHKIKPSILITCGTLGYATYSLLMTLSVPGISFYLAQILLGISGALFFVSSRVFLMNKDIAKKNSAFLWFYSAPTYADAIAPALGALLIWKTGFIGAFIAALTVQIIAALFAFLTLKKEKANTFKNIPLAKCIDNYKEVGTSMKFHGMTIPIITSFLVLILAGFHNTFFVIFLKDMSWTQNQILWFNALLYLSFLPISFLISKNIDRTKDIENISLGGKIAGLFSIILGCLTSVINAFSLFIIILSKNIGSLIANSGRSSLMGTKLKNYPAEAAAIDTIFSPLSTALGSLIGGVLIFYYGYSFIFIAFGIIIVTISLIIKKTSSQKSIRRNERN